MQCWDEPLTRKRCRLRLLHWPLSHLLRDDNVAGGDGGGDSGEAKPFLLPTYLPTYLSNTHPATT